MVHPSCRTLMPVLLLLFIIMPIVEIAVLIQVGSVIGLLPTVAIVIVTAVLGTTMLRQQGLATLARARQRMDQGEMPAQQLVEGLLLVVGGVLLLTPGFVTDAVGFLCLIPFTRALIATRMSREALLRVHVSSGGPQARGATGPGAHSPRTGPRTVGEGTSEAASAQSPPGTPPATPPGNPAATGKPASSDEPIEGDFRRVD